MHRNVVRATRGARLRAGIGIAIALTLAIAGSGAATAKSKSDIDTVRQLTARFNSLNQALNAGYVLFYKCTEQPGVGTMGQHFVKLSLVGDPAVDPLQPEVLVYEPKGNGGYKLAAVEYVTMALDWHNAFGAGTPTVLGQNMLFRAAGNRYGLPDFYERHAWIWKDNPAGMFADWNPNASCLGTGDNGG